MLFITNTLLSPSLVVSFSSVPESFQPALFGCRRTPFSRYYSFVGFWWLALRNDSHKYSSYLSHLDEHPILIVDMTKGLPKYLDSSNESMKCYNNIQNQCVLQLNILNKSPSAAFLQLSSSSIASPWGLCHRLASPRPTETLEAFAAWHNRHCQTNHSQEKY